LPGINVSIKIDITVMSLLCFIRISNVIGCH
jgi:hypothetical protein